MEKYFGKAYRGDPGVPHSGPEPFENIWIGAFAFSALTWSNPYMWHLTNQFKIYLYVQWRFLATYFVRIRFMAPHFVSYMKGIYHWKEAKAKKQPYKFKWNEYMDRELRDSYYFNWPVYFP